MSDLDRHASHRLGGVLHAVRDLLARLFASRTPPATPVAAARRPAPPPIPRRATQVVRQGGERQVGTRIRRAPEGILGVEAPEPAGPWNPGSDPSPEPSPAFRPRLAPTTRTYEMSQLAVLDGRLAGLPPAEAVTAGHLGLSHKVPAHAVLVALRWDGPPEYPYVHGRFSADADTALVADLDADALREVSRRLGLRQVWID